MKRITLLCALLGLAACATRPPLPPDCEGDLTPINGVASNVSGEKDVTRSGH